MSTPSRDPDRGAGGVAAQVQLQLGRDPRAPAEARAAVSSQLSEMDVEPARVQTVVLLVSEVVSNAVRHSSAPPDAPITLSSAVQSGIVRVDVTDAGEGFTPRPRDPERLGEGYGLYLLEKAARAWGVERVGGTTVWFEVELAAEPQL
jgi:anti-sigma regulatory factor (Ser/Thr protein kinase)